MTFNKFESIVKEKRPNIFKVFIHKDFAKSSTPVVAVQYSENGKVYTYTGSYVIVLNKLGIKTVTNNEVYQLKEVIKRLQRDIDFPKDEFGFGMSGGELDKKMLAEYQRSLTEIENNFVIV